VFCNQSLVVVSWTHNIRIFLQKPIWVKYEAVENICLNDKR